VIVEPSVVQTELYGVLSAVLSEGFGLSFVTDTECLSAERNGLTVELPIQLGDEHHALCLCADRDAARCLYTALTGHGEGSPSDADCRDAIAETLNVMVGRLAGSLERAGYAVSLGTPRAAAPEVSSKRAVASVGARLEHAAIRLEWFVT
jgi:hypothetical protein